MLITLLLSLFITNGRANTAAHFEKDNSAASIIISGTHDPDAGAFDQGLLLPAHSNGMVVQKDFLSADHGFQILCKSPQGMPQPICVVRFLASLHTWIDNNLKQAVYELGPHETGEMHTVFTTDSTGAYHFVTSDRKFEVTLTSASTRIVYADKGSGLTDGSQRH